MLKSRDFQTALSTTTQIPVPQCLGAASSFPSSHVTIFICLEHQSQSHSPFTTHTSGFDFAESHPPSFSFGSAQSKPLLPSVGMEPVGKEGPVLQGRQGGCQGWAHRARAGNAQLALRNPPSIWIQPQNFSPLQENDDYYCSTRTPNKKA